MKSEQAESKQEKMSRREIQKSIEKEKWTNVKKNNTIRKEMKKKMKIPKQQRIETRTERKQKSEM